MLKTIRTGRPKENALARGGGALKFPETYILENIDAAERATHPYVAVWEEALAFFDNDQWVERSAVSGNLVALETREGNPNAKPRWRSRLTRNRYTPGIERVRSRFAARVPQPQCSAPNHNAETRSAASLAEKAAVSMHRKLKVKQITLDTMVYTFNCGAGYVWPFWNPNVGKFVRDTRPLPELAAAAGGTLPGLPGGPEQQLPVGDPVDPRYGVGDPGLLPGMTIGPDQARLAERAPAAAPAEVAPPPEKWLREGEIDFWVLHPRDVGWQPGVPFEKSRWYYVRRARPASQIVTEDGYCGPTELAADAIATSNRDARNHLPHANLVFEYHYLERPSTKHRNGRWLRLGNGVEIFPEEHYPCDEDVPVIHELADIRRPHRDRPMGRGELALDIQRTYHRTANQIIHWKNLVLNPQMLAPKGSIRTPRTGEPGAVIEYVPRGGMAPAWQQVPEIPVGLFRTLDMCIADFQEVFGDGEIDLGNLQSGDQVAQVRAEKDESRRATFAENLACFYQDIYGHGLYLMRKHYTEPRLLEVKSRFGIESIANFMGAKLMPGITVYVDPGSVVPRTREVQEAKLIAFADRGWIPAHQILAAVRSGDVDSLIDEFELDEARAQREVQQLIAMGRMEGPGPVFAGPMDNHDVHLWVLGNWMKTEDFERQPELVKMATMAHYQQHDAERRFLLMEAQQQQLMAAEQRGMHGAAGGKATKPGEGGGASPPSPNGDRGGQPVISQPSVESNVRGLQGAPSAA